jgi:hypothetical protein
MSEPKKTRREILEAFVAQKPDDAFSRYGLALECVNSGDTAAADAHFRALLEKNSGYVAGYLMYAQMLVREARTDEAKKVLTLGVETAAQKRDSHALSELEALLAEIS